MQAFFDIKSGIRKLYDLGYIDKNQKERRNFRRSLISAEFCFVFEDAFNDLFHLL